MSAWCQNRTKCIAAKQAACLRDLSQRGAIIGCEFFNPLVGQLMINVKTFPWLIESEILVEDRLAGCRVFESTVGRRKAVASPIVQNLRRHGHQVSFERKAVEQLF